MRLPGNVCLILGASLSLAATVYCQLPPFDTWMNLPVGSRPWPIATADLDGDGDNDLAVGNSGDNAIGVLINNGDGTFEPQVEIPTPGCEMGAIAAADLDQDGDTDLATLCSGYGMGDLLIYTNNGDGTFGLHDSHDLVSLSPRWVCAADLDGDGDKDLSLATGAGFHTIAVLLNAGDGVFGDPANYWAGPQPLSIAAADLNGDGDNDLATACHYGDFEPDTNFVSILENNGDATFAPPSGLWPGTKSIRFWQSILTKTCIRISSPPTNRGIPYPFSSTEEMGHSRTRLSIP